jgi:hypothetical protein
VTHTARVDGFIDDRQPFLDTPENREKTARGPPGNALHKPTARYEGKPITRRDIVSGPKLDS